MIKLEDIESMRESCVLEAKSAAGGLPESLWETFSAFANTKGGVILLGVEERADHSLYINGLADPYDLLDDFYNQLESGRMSADYLSSENVRIRDCNGKRIIEIEIPRAPRRLRPVFVAPDPSCGTYIRQGEADIRCDKRTVKNMIDKRRRF